MEVKQCICRSWMDPRHARTAGRELAEKLVERCRGEKVVMLSLTYRREWENPYELYRAAAEERHVRRFIERLSVLTGCMRRTESGRLVSTLTGKWLCKMEFQAGGWLHWHIVLICDQPELQRNGRAFVGHDVVSQAWDYGHCWISRGRPKELAYLGKYVAKGGELPAFLLGEPIRSVKVVRCSPGFWGEPCEEEREEPEPSQRVSAYISIGQSMERARGRCLIRNEDTGEVQTWRQPAHLVVIRAIRNGFRVVGSRGGWLVMEGGRAARLAPASPRPPLHLNTVTKSAGSVIPRWLERLFWECASWNGGQLA